MSSFGLIGWGVGAWGAPIRGQVSSDFRKPSPGHGFGTTSGQGKLDEDRFISVTELDNAIKFGTSPATVAHARAYIQTFTVPRNPKVEGTPIAADLVLKAKTWALEIDPLLKTYVPGTSDLSAFISTWFRQDSDISAEIRSFSQEDVLASLLVNPAINLSAYVQTIPGVNLGGTMQTIPGVNLGAIGGGHFPVDIGAPVVAVPPVQLPSYIRGGFTGEENLTASLNQIGFFTDIYAFLNVASRESTDLGAKMGVISRGTKNIIALLQPIHSSDLPASIITQRIFDTRAIITAVHAEMTYDISAILRQVVASTSNFGVAPFKAVVSTHTSDKQPNLDKVVKPLHQNRYLFGSSSGGLFFLTLEPVFGIFPDLHAEINALRFYRENIGGFVRAAIPTIKDLLTDITSVSPFININKLVLDLIPLLNLPGDLIQVGGYSELGAITVPKRSVSTGTDANAGFSTTATTYRFFIGTSRGLFIPPQLVPVLLVTSYRNEHPRPDLHATLTGWHTASLGASIKDYSFSAFPASIVSWDLNHLSELKAHVGAFHITDMTAYVNPSGGMHDFNASLDTKGAAYDFNASLIPYINPLSFNIVSVSTKPFKDMGAIINYSTLGGCTPRSAVVSLGAHVRPYATGSGDILNDMPAELNALRIVLDIGAEIVGRKRTRLSVLSLNFKSKTRSAAVVYGSITPVASKVIDVSATIQGLLHEKDLAATLTPLRFAPHDADFTALETIVNLATGDLKTVLVAFRSQVSSYIFEEVTSAVYATDRDTWAIDLRSLIRDPSFFDRSLKTREFSLDEVAEFASIDEAIRHALVILCERQQDNILASISARGAIRDLGVEIGIISGNRLSDFASNIVAVANSPDITAVINAFGDNSDLVYLGAVVIPSRNMERTDITSSIFGNNDTDLVASITVT